MGKVRVLIKLRSKCDFNFTFFRSSPLRNPKKSWAKKNKNYFVSTKDLMLLESLQSDGVKISKKYLKLFQFNQSDIPTDLQLLINNNEIGLVLLRFVEIIGEDEFINLGSDTIYFMVDALNQLNIDSIRNNILLKVLPKKV